MTQYFYNPSSKQSQLEAEIKATQDERKKLKEQTSDRGRATADLTAGEALGKQFIQTGSLGSIDTRFAEAPSADMADIIARRRAALTGMSSEEQTLRREQAVGEIDRSTETQRRRLQAIQGASGVRGDSASMQQAQVLMEGGRTRGNFERDLYIQNEQMKREALGAFEGSITLSERNTMERQAANIELDKFNLQQRAQEKFGQISTALGYSQILQADRSAKLAADAQRAAAAASGGGCFGADTMIKMDNGSYKKISEIAIGDHTLGGVVYSVLKTAAPSNNTYLYDGSVVVAGTHAVMENDKFLRINHSNKSEKVEYTGHLYNIGVSNHLLLAEETYIFSDLDEVNHPEDIYNQYLSILNGKI